MTKDPRPRIRLLFRIERSGTYFHPKAHFQMYLHERWDSYPGWRSGLLLDDLRIRGQGDPTTDNVYAIELRYDAGHVGLYACQRMVKTLQFFERKLRALELRLGSPQTFGAYLARIADAVKAQSIMLPADNMFVGNPVDEHRIGMAVSRIDYVIANHWLPKPVPQEAVTA